MDAAEPVRARPVQAGAAAHRDAAALAARRFEPGRLGAVELLAAAGVDGGAEREAILMLEPHLTPIVGAAFGFFGLQVTQLGTKGAMTEQHFGHTQPVFNGVSLGAKGIRGFGGKR